MPTPAYTARGEVDKASRSKKITIYTNTASPARCRQPKPAYTAGSEADTAYTSNNTNTAPSASGNPAKPAYTAGGGVDKAETGGKKSLKGYKQPDSRTTSASYTTTTGRATRESPHSGAYTACTSKNTNTASSVRGKPAMPAYAGGGGLQAYI